MPDLEEQIGRLADAVVDRTVPVTARTRPNSAPRARWPWVVAAAAGIMAVLGVFAFLGADEEAVVTVGDDAVETVTTPAPGPVTTPSEVEAGIFGERTGTALIFDDGYDGIVIVDLDAGVATRRSIGGAPGDQPVRLWRSGDSLLAGWNGVTVTSLDDFETSTLAGSWVFLPSPVDGELWLIGETPANDGETPVRLVELDGTVLAEGMVPGAPVSSPTLAFRGGLVLNGGGSGLTLWHADGSPPSVLGGAGAPAEPMASSRTDLAWCQGWPCTEVHITDTATLDEVLVDLPPGQGGFVGWGARFSHDGRYLAVVVQSRAGVIDDDTTGELAVVDVESGEIVFLSDKELDPFFSIAWSRDDSEVWIGENAWGDPATRIGRHRIGEDALELADLPVGNILGFVTAAVDELPTEPVVHGDAEECEGGGPNRPAPTDRPLCSFRLDVP